MLRAVEPLARAVVDWFRAGHRPMPWRGSRDPYAIWVSEIMLQQTRVETVIPYYQRWMTRFPTVSALAAAPLDDVLTAWAGLGYYSRARNLHAAANDVVANYGCQLPSTSTELRSLRGIGAYTAGAIASIAFGERAAALDGNVARVLSRLFAVETTQREQLQPLAESLVPVEDPSSFNQGLMELGATICTPSQPRCFSCPVRRHCQAHATGRAAELPRKAARRRPKTVDAVAVVARDRTGRVLLCRRPATRGLFAGLYEPPWGERGQDDIETAAHRLLGHKTGLSGGQARTLAPLTHQLTHRTLCFSVVEILARGKLRLTDYDDARWISLEDDPPATASWSRAIFTSLRATRGTP
jgi:A/G-specific adenine glycosylase